MADLPSLQQTADYLGAALLHQQQTQQPPPHPPPQAAASLDQHWMPAQHSQQSLQAQAQAQPQQYYQQQQQQQQPMDVSEFGVGQSLVPPSGSSGSTTSSSSQSGTPSPPRPRSSLGHSQPSTAHSTVYSSASSHSYHHVQAPPASFHTANTGSPYSSTYPLPAAANVTLATTVGESASPPPSGHWLNPSRLPLPSMSTLSRSASSSLPSSSTSLSSPLLQSTPQPPRLQRRNMGPPSSANVSPAAPPHSLGLLSLHSSSPLASPDLPPLHPNSAQSMLPPPVPSIAATQQFSSAASQLPPFHPPSSSHSLHSSPSQMSQPSPSIMSPPTVQVPRSRGQSASSYSSSSSSAPNSPTPLQHHIPSCTLSLDGQFQDANPAFLATFQFFSAAALLQQSIYSVVHPTEHLSFMVMMRRIMTGKVKSLAQEKLCVPLSHSGAPSRPIPMWLMMSAVTLDEKLLTLYCCFLPKPRREEFEDEQEKAELRLELEGRAQLQQTQLELQDEMLRIERMYQQQFAALNQQQHRYGITQQMIDQYSATGAAQASSSASTSSPPLPPRDPSQLSLSGLPKPQQLHLQQLQQTNNELKVLQAQHTAKLTRFMQLLARQSPFQAALGSATNTLFSPSTFGSRSHTAPSMGGNGSPAQPLINTDPSRIRTGSEPGDWTGPGRSAEDAKMSVVLASPSSTMSATSSMSLPHVRSFSQSFASTTGVDTPSPLSDSPYSRASSALLSSSTSSAV